MRLRKVSIRNVRSIEKLDWKLPAKGGWNVVLGDNGSGKSSVLRAIALALIGPETAAAARQDWSTWLRSGSNRGTVRIDYSEDPQFDGNWGQPINYITSDRNHAEVMIEKNGGRATVEMPDDSKRIGLWEDTAGWFCASYGAYRKFSGGTRETESIYNANPKLGAHLTLFDQSAPLSKAQEWLRELRYKQLEKQPESDLLDQVQEFVNQDGFLPYGVHMTKVSSEGVEFSDANGMLVSVDELGDGYRSILSMTFELLRQLWERFKNSDVIFSADKSHVAVPGVVLVDEIDAHLHPTWQKEIGFWLTRLFPRVQFIVTTHSPLICHAAINGSIFRLPRPGSDNEGKMLTKTQYQRLIYGDILDAYSTGAFGTESTRPKKAYEKLERLAELNLKEIRLGLSEEEREEQAVLRSTFPRSPHSSSAA